MLATARLLTVREVALTLRQSERTVRGKIASGELAALRIGSGPRAPLRIDERELLRWIYGAPAGHGAASSMAGSPRGEAEA